MACNAQSLIETAVAAGYDKLSDRDLKEALVAAACAGAGGGSGSVLAGNYGGVAPAITPSGPAVARDTVTGSIWWYNSTDGWTL